MERREKLELVVRLQGEPGEEQVRELLARASHVAIARDGLGNWWAVLVDHQGWTIERLFYQNPGANDLNHDDTGPISLCHAWDVLVPGENEADLRISPEWGSLAAGVLRDIASAASQALEKELGQRWINEYGCCHAILVASSASGPVRDLHSVARDDPTVLPILRDRWREELP